MYQIFGKETLDQLIPVAAGFHWSALVCRSLRHGGAKPKIPSLRVSPATFAYMALFPSLRFRS